MDAFLERNSCETDNITTTTTTTSNNNNNNNIPAIATTQPNQCAVTPWFVSANGRPDLDHRCVVGGDTVYTVRQLTAIARTLRKWKQPSRLVRLLSTVPASVVGDCDLLLYSAVWARFHLSHYDHVVDVLLGADRPPLAEQYHRELQAIWDECHYRRFERDKGKYPQEVQRFRIRKKHTYPACIWNGDKFKYSFTLRDRELMERYFRRCSKPTRKVKEELAERTHLTVQQVTTWFKNKRNRHTRVGDDDGPCLSSSSSSSRFGRTANKRSRIPSSTITTKVQRRTHSLRSGRTRRSTVNNC